MRTVIAAAIVGTVLGIMLTPAGGEAQLGGRLYSTWITAPTGNASSSSNYWESVPLSCGWHSVCLWPYPDGPALDWGRTEPTGGPVRFRGFFKRSNSSYETNYLRAVADEIYSGTLRCDEVQVRVEEKYGSPQNWHYRWEMRYTHANRGPVDQVFQIATTGTTTGVFNQFWVANMVGNDSQNCDWTGIHVHDMAFINHAYPKAIPGWAEDRVNIPRAPGGGSRHNGHWNRYFEWAEAYP